MGIEDCNIWLVGYSRISFKMPEVDQLPEDIGEALPAALRLPTVVDMQQLARDKWKKTQKK